MPIYEKEWFKRAVDFLRRKWSFFDKYVYGHSKNYEDFYRNPFETLYETVWPFWVPGAEPHVLFVLRAGYITYPATDYPGTPGTHVPMLKGTPAIRGKRWTYLNFAWRPPWQTKYYNAAFAFQVGAMKRGWALYPYVTMVIRPTNTLCFHAGIGWGYEANDSGLGGSFFAKFRLGHYAKEKEWNPTEIYGFYEGVS